MPSIDSLNFPSDPSTTNPPYTYGPDTTPPNVANQVTYLYSNGKWTAQGDGYLPISGGLLTGDLEAPYFIGDGRYLTNLQVTSESGGTVTLITPGAGLATYNAVGDNLPNGIDDEGSIGIDPTGDLITGTGAFGGNVTITDKLTITNTGSTPFAIEDNIITATSDSVKILNSDTDETVSHATLEVGYINSVSGNFDPTITFNSAGSGILLGGCTFADSKVSIDATGQFDFKNIVRGFSAADPINPTISLASSTGDATFTGDLSVKSIISNGNFSTTGQIKNTQNTIILNTDGSATFGNYTGDTCGVGIAADYNELGLSVNAGGDGYSNIAQFKSANGVSGLTIVGDGQGEFTGNVISGDASFATAYTYMSPGGIGVMADENTPKCVLSSDGSTQFASGRNNVTSTGDLFLTDPDGNHTVDIYSGGASSFTDKLQIQKAGADVALFEVLSTSAPATFQVTSGGNVSMSGILSCNGAGNFDGNVNAGDIAAAHVTIQSTGYIDMVGNSPTNASRKFIGGSCVEMAFGDGTLMIGGTLDPTYAAAQEPNILLEPSGASLFKGQLEVGASGYTSTAGVSLAPAGGVYCQTVTAAGKISTDGYVVPVGGLYTGATFTNGTGAVLTGAGGFTLLNAADDSSDFINCWHGTTAAENKRFQVTGDGNISGQSLTINDVGGQISGSGGGLSNYLFMGYGTAQSIKFYTWTGSDGIPAGRVVATEFVDSNGYSLEKSKTALQAIKTAALDPATDLAGLKAAIVAALADH